MKEKTESAWEGFRIFVMGGGVYERALWERCAERTRVAREIAPLPILRAPHGLPRDLYARFPAAIGLAFPLALWPLNYLPSQVDPWGPVRQIRRFRDSEELGYGEK